MPAYHNMLNAANAAPTYGAWIPTTRFRSGVLHVHGIVAGDEVTVQGSCEGTLLPGAAETVGSVITADGLYSFDHLPGSLRVGMTNAGGGGTVSVDATFREA